MFHSWWLPLMTDVEQRAIILGVLRNHGLIALKGELIEVTEKGREYLAFRGPLPQPSETTLAATGTGTK